MQTELLNRRPWRTRLELANAIFETVRSSTTGNVGTPRSECAPPIEYELRHNQIEPIARPHSPPTRLRETHGTSPPRNSVRVNSAPGRSAKGGIRHDGPKRPGSKALKPPDPAAEGL
jgi:hypothetical protein